MRPLCLLLALLAAGLATGTAPGAEPPALKKLRILMVFDTSDKDLAPSLKIDDWRMRRLVKKTIPESMRTLDVLTGKDVTADKIFDYYKKLKTGADEGLLFFYGGHGAIDPKKGHYFQLTNGKALVRGELRAAMEAKKAGVVLIISDCCS